MQAGARRASKVIGVKVAKVLRDPDGSVNFILEGIRSNGKPIPGFFECRIVRRKVLDHLGRWVEGPKLSFYLSPLDGCPLGCPMCYLTQTGSRSSTPADLDLISLQFSILAKEYERMIRSGETTTAERVNCNWMARGDALLNRNILFQYPEIHKRLSEIARGCTSTKPGGLAFSNNVSTIFPHSIPTDSQGFPDLLSVFPLGTPVHLYWSAYSVVPKTRKILVPNSLPADQILQGISRFQQATRQRITLHGAVLKGLNDSKEESDLLAESVIRFGILGNCGQVQFNAHPNNPNLVEADQADKDYQFKVLSEAFQFTSSRWGPDVSVTAGASKQIARIGLEALASCGTFFHPELDQP